MSLTCNSIVTKRHKHQTFTSLFYIITNNIAIGHYHHTCWLTFINYFVNHNTFRSHTMLIY